MLYKVTSIEFDFTSDDDSLTPEEQQDIVTSVCSGDWDADNVGDLVECITDETGWCVQNITYKLVNI